MVLARKRYALLTKQKACKDKISQKLVRVSTQQTCSCHQMALTIKHCILNVFVLLQQRRVCFNDSVDVCEHPGSPVKAVSPSKPVNRCLQLAKNHQISTSPLAGASGTSRFGTSQNKVIYFNTSFNFIFDLNCFSSFTEYLCNFTNLACVFLSIICK